MTPQSLDPNQLRQLQEKNEAKRKQQWESPENLMEFLSYTLDNFAHRYLENNFSGPLKVQSEQNGTTFNLWVEAKQNSMKEALQTPDPHIQEAIKELARKFPKANNPHVLNRLEAKMLDYSPGKSGKLQITSSINWDYPDFKTARPYENHGHRQVLLSFAEPFELRHSFPKALEEVCALY